MIAMKVTYKNMIDAYEPEMIASELHLCAFAAINQKQFFIMVDQLGRWVSIARWSS